MTRKLISLMLALIVLATPVSLSAAPPVRPLALTAAQFDRLGELEAQSAHASILDLHATYKSEREKSLDATRLSDDILTVAWQGGFPVAIIIMLIAAAPL